MTFDDILSASKVMFIILWSYCFCKVYRSLQNYTFFLNFAIEQKAIDNRQTDNNFKNCTSISKQKFEIFEFQHITILKSSGTTKRLINRGSNGPLSLNLGSIFLPKKPCLLRANLWWDETICMHASKIFTGFTLFYRKQFAIRI